MARKKSLSQITPPMVKQVQIPTLGSAPLTALTPEAQQVFGKMLGKKIPQWIDGSNNPLWNDKEELANIKLLSSVMNPGPFGNTNINDRFSKRHTVADLNIPRNPTAMLQLAMRYALENAFVAKATKLKTDYTCEGFSIKTHKTSAKEFYDDYNVKLNIRIQLSRIMWSYFGLGIVPIYWGGEEGGPITFMQVLHPLACHYEEILGKQRLYLKIDVKMIDAVKDPQGIKDPRNKEQYDSMPGYWIVEIKKMIEKGQGIGMIQLAEGSYTVVENRYAAWNRSHNTLDGIPLQPAFDALQRYRLLAAGDFAVAWNLKNMITIISEGDPKIDPKNYTPLDDARQQKLMSTFLNPDYSLTVFADPTTNIRFFVPPMEVFDPKKYAQCEKEIKEVMGLPSFMWHSDGNGTFGAAAAEVRVLFQEIKAARETIIEQLFRPLYARLREGVSRPGFRIQDIPMPTFSVKSLHDDVAWMTNSGELYQQGAISLESHMENSDLDFNYEMAQKELEHKKYGNTSPDAVQLNNTPARPLFEPSQGATSAKEPGNPGKSSDGTNKADGSSTPRNPRPSGK